MTEKNINEVLPPIAVCAKCGYPIDGVTTALPGTNYFHDHCPRLDKSKPENEAEYFYSHTLNKDLRDMELGKPILPAATTEHEAKPEWDAGCKKCGASYMGRDHTCFEGKLVSDTPELSLLVIDLGDCRVVKYESGMKSLLSKLSDRLGEQLRKDRTAFTFVTLEGLKEEFDALDKPPVPRIERPTNGNYTLHVGNVVKPYTFELPFEMLDALSQLAGKPLPIYEPSKGNWRQIGVESDGQKAESISIWRFTR